MAGPGEEVVEWVGFSVHGLLAESVEEQPAAAAVASVESEGELLQVCRRYLNEVDTQFMKFTS